MLGTSNEMASVFGGSGGRTGGCVGDGGASGGRETRVAPAMV